MILCYACMVSMIASPILGFQNLFYQKSSDGIALAVVHSGKLPSCARKSTNFHVKNGLWFWIYFMLLFSVVTTIWFDWVKELDMMM